MSEPLYSGPVGFHLGFFPSVYVMPSTVEGVRCLALEALRVGEITVLDKLELHIIRLLKIRPDCDIGKEEKPEPERLFHEPGGIVIQWRIKREDECPACEGTGHLTAYGKDCCDYDVDCPRCYGCGVAEDADERCVITDIDGGFVREAA